MGNEIGRESFSDEDYARFAARLRDCLDVLREVLARPGFGTGATTIGAELEVFLIDVAGRPLAVNDGVVAAAADPAVTLETDRFNLECHTLPAELTGRPFAGLAQQLERTLALVREAAAAHGARIAIIGILPTLRAQDLQSDVLSASPRYRALSAGIRRLRRAPFTMRIEGPETLDVCCDDVTFEGANTAWQVHLKVPPADFARTFNAAQVAIAPALAASCNSPTFLGHRLWQETRVALYRLSVDERAAASADDWRPARVSFGHGWVREGAWELFAESVAQHAPLLPLMTDDDPRATPRSEAPVLGELRVHQGTVWHWNRAVYDHTAGGHIRIEMRPLPAGPTIVDMLANTAFLLGLTLALAPRADRLVTGLTFGQARRNFYEAARHGLDAELLWPTDDTPSPRPHAARRLVRQLIPLAHDALTGVGVVGEEVASLLDIFEARVATSMTGARWQLASLAALERRNTRDAALAVLLDRYLEHSASGAPVHTWPVASP